MPQLCSSPTQNFACLQFPTKEYIQITWLVTQDFPQPKFRWPFEVSLCYPEALDVQVHQATQVSLRTAAFPPPLPHGLSLAGRFLHPFP